MHRQATAACSIRPPGVDGHRSSRTAASTAAAVSRSSAGLLVMTQFQHRQPTLKAENGVLHRGPGNFFRELFGPPPSRWRSVVSTGSTTDGCGVVSTSSTAGLRGVVSTGSTTRLPAYATCGLDKLHSSGHGGRSPSNPPADPMPVDAASPLARVTTREHDRDVERGLAWRAYSPRVSGGPSLRQCRHARVLRSHRFLDRHQRVPADAHRPSHAAVATADVSSTAAGGLTTIAYTWTHPDDGEQDGLLVRGPDDDLDSVIALWGDSWRKSPAARSWWARSTASRCGSTTSTPATGGGDHRRRDGPRGVVPPDGQRGPGVGRP